jgi:hypothetical protein
MHFFAEVEDQGDGFRLVRTHRDWHGKLPKDTETTTFEKIDVPDYISDEPVLYAIELQPDEIPEGQSVKLKGGLVLTSEPDRYGDPDARAASGKKSPVRLKFEEWVPVL